MNPISNSMTSVFMSCNLPSKSRGQGTADKERKEIHWVSIVECPVQEAAHGEQWEKQESLPLLQY